MDTRFRIPRRFVKVDRLLAALFYGELASNLCDMGIEDVEHGIPVLNDEGSWLACWGDDLPQMTAEAALRKGKTILYTLSGAPSRGEMTLCLDGEARPVGAYLNDNHERWLKSDLSNFAIALKLTRSSVAGEIGVSFQSEHQSGFVPGAPYDLVHAAVRVLNPFIKASHRIRLDGHG